MHWTKIYDFTTDSSRPGKKPTYSILTDLNTEEGIWSFGHPLLLGEAAISWALLAAIIIVASREVRTLLKQSQEIARLSSFAALRMTLGSRFVSPRLMS